MPRTRLPLIAALPLVLAAAACSSSATTARVERLVGGPGAVDVLRDGSDAVTREAYRIDGMAHMNDTAADAERALHGYPILAGPVPVPADLAADVSRALLRDGTYLWDLAKACEFLPGVALRQSRGDTTHDVLICFSCDEVEFYVNGTKTGHEDTDPERATLVRAAKRLFPGDAKIQSLR